jgi:thiol-disulfide isomerase/thioredoxin
MTLKMPFIAAVVATFSLVSMDSLSQSDARLPVERMLPPLTGATAWLNSPALTPDGLRGKVVLVDFLTFTCINWQRSQPYVRAWAEKYKDHGLVVIGVHTPEFAFEKDIDNVRRELAPFRVRYPVAVDRDYAVWNAFDNRYWPAIYIVDANGRIRFHHFGEGEYERTERVLQQLLREAGYSDFATELVKTDARGSEVAADWDNLRSPETYLGRNQAQGFSSPGGAVVGKSRRYAAPRSMAVNRWALSGDWTVTPGFVVLDKPGGRIAHRFHARDVHLVMGPANPGTPVRFRVLVDGQPPGDGHGTDVDANGYGTATSQRLYQLVRQSGTVKERLFEIEFLDPGIEAYAFAFG